MPASMCRKFTARTIAAGAMLMALGACEHYAPNQGPERGSTEALTRAEAERIQDRGASRVFAPSQIRIATGPAQHADGACRDWLDPCWEAGADAPAPTVTVPALARVVRPADAQTFRGILPCQGDAMHCTGQHATLTLFVNQTWRARVSYLNAAGQSGAPADLQGCWERNPGAARHLVLYHTNGNVMGEFEATSANTLAYLSPEAQPVSLSYTLTRQPDPDLQGGKPAAGSCRR